MGPSFRWNKMFRFPLWAAKKTESIGYEQIPKRDKNSARDEFRSSRRLSHHYEDADTQVLPILDRLENFLELGPLPAITCQERETLRVFGFYMLKSKAPLIPKDAPHPPQYKGHIHAPRHRYT